MRKFYAVYDQEDNFITCGYSAREIGFTDPVMSQHFHRNKQVRGLKVYEIPLEPQDDVFKEEDELFLEEEKENAFTDKELAVIFGVCRTTIWKKRRLNVKRLD